MYLAQPQCFGNCCRMLTWQWVHKFRRDFTQQRYEYSDVAKFVLRELNFGNPKTLKVTGIATL